MGLCPTGYQIDPSGDYCNPDGTGTDPSYYPPPDIGNIQYGGDPSIDPPQSNADGCYVGETDPITGDTIASCGVHSGGGVNPTGITPTVVSPSMWQSIGGTLGAFLGGLSKAGQAPSSIPVGSKRCFNGQIVLNSQACPVSSASVLGASSSGAMTMILLAALVLIIVFALRR